MVYSGIVSYEIFGHHNYLLNNFYAPAVDPYYLSDVIPFQLLPQIISNFNPSVLKCVAFLIFSLIILVYGILVYKITKNVTNSLIFTALVSNLAVLPFTSIYDWPSSHMATIFFIGILLLLLFEFPSGNKWYYFLSIAILAAISFSDSIIIIWLIIPGVIYYIYTYRHNIVKSAFWFIAIALTLVGIITITKLKFIPTFLPAYSPLQLVGWQTIQNNFMLFIGGITSIYNESLFYFTQGSAQLTIIDILSIISSLWLLLYAFVFVYKNIHEKIIIFFISSGLTIFFVYVFTNTAQGLSTTRYLSLFALFLFVIISLSFKNENKVFLVLVILSLVFIGYSNISFIEKINNPPNQQNYQLIEYLESNQLTFGFGDFWDANLDTYLSHQEVIIRPVSISSGQITQLRWHSTENWYNTSSIKKYFIAVTDDGEFVNNESLDTYLPYHSPIQILHFGKYTIYEFNEAPQVVNKIIFYKIGNLTQVNTSYFVNVSASDGKGYALYGPYEQFPEGEYTVDFNISQIDQINNILISNNTSFCRIDVVANGGQKVFAEKEISPENLTQKNGTSLDFTLQESENLEFRVWSEGVASFMVEAVPQVSQR
jgi:hypothetical protein